jgi:hypothetical protein
MIVVIGVLFGMRSVELRETASGPAGDGRAWFLAVFGVKGGVSREFVIYCKAIAFVKSFD